MAAVGVPFHTTTTSTMALSSSSSSCALPDGIPPAAAVTEFEYLADFLMLDQAEFAPSTFATDQYSPPPIAVAPFSPCGAVTPPVADRTLGNFTTNSSGGAEGGRREDHGGRARIAFRTRSEVEILDDGFKWRKYGKKSVKNSPNPRNYYRCSTEGCLVKKRVEKDKDDPSYVITTYEGVHNHVSPAVVYYTSKDAVSGLFYVAGCQMPAPASSSSC